MEKSIRDRYSQSIYNQALEYYLIDPDRIRELDGFESYIYEFEKDDVAYELTDSWWQGEDDLNTTHTIDLYCTGCGGDILLFIKKLTKERSNG